MYMRTGKHDEQDCRKYFLPGGKVTGKIDIRKTKDDHTDESLEQPDLPRCGDYIREWPWEGSQ